VKKKTPLQKDRAERAAYLRKLEAKLAAVEKERRATVRQLVKLEKRIEVLWGRGEALIKEHDDILEGNAKYPGGYRHSFAAIRDALRDGMSVEDAARKFRFGVWVVERIKKEMADA